MLNILSYIGVNLQSELCLWTLLGLMRTIFDATLFKVNANLKQVWQMSMPPELSMPVQRALRTIISGVMLVQCFTVYVYLASYIVLLYPVFLEERPTLVLPWLLLAAIRKFLCELTSLALGLGACVLLGPARPPCIKFVIFKIASITPAFYMWMLVFSYYNALKVASAFKRLPAVMATNDHDYGLELAVRRRRTKSLQDEEQLRRKLVASLNYDERPSLSPPRLKSEMPSRMMHSTHASIEDVKAELLSSIAYNAAPAPHSAERVLSDLGSYEDWCGSEITVPRDADRILEQFVIMSLRIQAFLKTEGTDPSKMFTSSSRELRNYTSSNMDCGNLQNEDADTPPLVGNTKGKTASYLQEYPQIFMKKPTDSVQIQDEPKISLKQSKHALRSSRANVSENQNTMSNQKSVKISEKIEDYHISTRDSKTSQPQEIQNISNDEDLQNKRYIFKSSIESNKRTNLAVDTDAEGIEMDQIMKSYDEKYNKMEQTTLERDLKEVSQETYNSFNQNISTKTRTDLQIVMSDDSLHKIIERMRKYLPKSIQSDEKDEINEADGPISTRILNEMSVKNTSQQAETSETNLLKNEIINQNKKDPPENKKNIIKIQENYSTSKTKAERYSGQSQNLPEKESKPYEINEPLASKNQDTKPLILKTQEKDQPGSTPNETTTIKISEKQPALETKEQYLTNTEQTILSTVNLQENDKLSVEIKEPDRESTSKSPNMQPTDSQSLNLSNTAKEANVRDEEYKKKV